MKLRLQIALVLIASLLAGCGNVTVFGRTIGEKHSASEAKAEAREVAASTAKTQPNKTQPDKTQPERTASDKPATVRAPAVPVPSARVAKSVTLMVTPQAAAKVSSDARFSADALLAAIKSELRSRKLLDDTDSHAITLEISVDDYALHPMSNVILFGNITNAGTLGGSVRMRDEHGSNLPDRRIDAESRVSIPVNGKSTNPLESLYRQFAIMTGNLLDGAQLKPAFSADQHPRS